MLSVKIRPFSVEPVAFYPYTTTVLALSSIFLANLLYAKIMRNYAVIGQSLM